MPPRVLVILNPVSGTADAASVRAELDRALRARGVAFEIRETEGEGDAFAWARDAADVDLVLAVGGDGTVMEAMSGLIHADDPVPLAQLPTGTANLLAVALGLPSDPEEAVAIALEGAVVPFDVGYLPQRERYFALAVGAGWNAEVVRDASRPLKRRLGSLAYVWTGLRNLFRLRPSRVRLWLDDEERELRAHSVMIINVGDVAGAAFRAGHGVDPHDGKLDLAVLSAHTFLGLLRLGVRLFTQDLRANADAEHFAVERVRLEATPPLSVQIDGEYVGHTPVEVRVRADAVRLRVPRAYVEKRGLEARELRP